MMRLFIFIFSFSVFFNSHGFEKKNTWDLKSTISFAIEHSPFIKKRKQILEMESFATSQKNAYLYPTLFTEFSSTYKGDSVSGTFSEGDFKVGITQNLFNSTKDISLIKKKENELEAEKIRYELGILEIKKNILLHFINFSESFKFLEIEQNNLKVLASQYKKIDFLYKSGLRAKSEVQRFKAQVERNRIRVLNLENELPIIKEALKAEMGFKEEDNSTFKMTPLNIPLSNNAYSRFDFDFSIKLENTLNYALIDYEKKALQNQIYLNEINYYPTVSLDFIVNQNIEDIYVNPSSFSNWSATFNIRYNFFDFGKLRDGIRSQVADSKSRIYQADTEAFKLKQNIKSLIIDFKRQKKEMDMRLKLLGIQEENFARIKSEYEKGRLGYLDFIDGLNGSLDSKREYYKILFSMYKSLSEYLYYKREINKFTNYIQ